MLCLVISNHHIVFRITHAGNAFEMQSIRCNTHCIVRHMQCSNWFRVLCEKNNVMGQNKQYIEKKVLLELEGLTRNCKPTIASIMNSAPVINQMEFVINIIA